MRRAALVAAAALALAAAGCGSSPEDKAKDAGEEIGGQLYTVRTASSVAEVRDALEQIKQEVQDLGELPAGYRDQISDIATQLQTSLQGASDAAARRTALADARSQLQELSSETNSVVNEFRRGVRQGYEDAAD
jgi:ABC-type transporter Mla subunit MlaD